MESRLKHAEWNKRADWNFPQKTINVQDLIRACRVIKKFEINKRACTFIRYSRVPIYFIVIFHIFKFADTF